MSIEEKPTYAQLEAEVARLTAQLGEYDSTIWALIAQYRGEIFNPLAPLEVSLPSVDPTVHNSMVLPMDSNMPEDPLVVLERLLAHLAGWNKSYIQLLRQYQAKTDPNTEEE